MCDKTTKPQTVTNGANGTWPEWRRYILKSIEDLLATTKELSKIVHILEIKVAELYVKSGLWGVAGSAIPILIAFIIWLLKNHLF